MLYLSLWSSLPIRNITRGIVPRFFFFFFFFLCSFSLLFHIVSPNTENTYSEYLTLFSVRSPYCIMRSVVVVMSKRICVNILVMTDLVPKKQLRVPRSTRPRAGSGWRHARPTQQLSVTPTKERAPMTDSASGGRGGLFWGRIARSPGWRITVKKWKC